MVDGNLVLLLSPSILESGPARCDRLRNIWGRVLQQLLLPHNVHVHQQPKVHFVPLLGLRHVHPFLVRGDPAPAWQEGLEHVIELA